MKDYSAYTKSLASLKPHHQIVLCHILETPLGKFYRSAEMQSLYYAAPTDRAIIIYGWSIQLEWLLRFVIKYVLYNGACVKFYFVCLFICFYAYCLKDLWPV